jgi:voltage-gated potassium channel
VQTASADDGDGRLDELDIATGRRLVARTAAVSGALMLLSVVLYSCAPLQGGGSATIAGRVAGCLALIVIAVLVAWRFVRSADHPILMAAVALAGVVSLALVSFASAYVVMSTNDPAAFTEPLSRVDALYFTMVTATTLGYGDISPTSEPARVVVMLQIVANVVVIGVAARALMETARRRSRSV